MPKKKPDLTRYFDKFYRILDANIFIYTATSQEKNSEKLGNE